MIEILREVISDTTSDDPEIREEATLQLALVIERNLPGREFESYHETLLSPDLLGIRLNEEEQKELVAEIGRIVTSDKVTPRMVWVLAKCTSLSALEYLLVLVCNENVIPDKHSVWEALLGIELFLSPSQDSDMRRRALSRAQKYDFQRALQRIARSSDEETRELAQRILDRMQ